MVVRLLLVCHGFTSAMAGSSFPDDEPVERRGLGGAELDHPADRVVRGPELRCVQTAEALGLRADPAAELSDWDLGRWRGRTLAGVRAEEPDGIRRWLSDPAEAPHGGESVLDVIGRVARWLDGSPNGRSIAVTHPAVIRAAVVHALQAPPETFWRIDVEPLARVSLTGRNGRWNLRFEAGT